MSKPQITFEYPEILERLAAFFPAERIKSFPLIIKNDGSMGMAAFYIDNRGVIERLNETCVWQNVFKKDPRDSLGKSILCGIKIKIMTPGTDGEFIYEWITRWDGADNTDIEGTKGGLSSAQRRAAVQFGIGHYLYEVPGQWLDMKPVSGNNKPKYFKSTPRIPSEFLPKGSGAQRARSVSSEPEKPVTTAAKTENVFKLTAAMTKKYAVAKKGKDLKQVTTIFESVLTQGITPSEGLKQIAALPTSK